MRETVGTLVALAAATLVGACTSGVADTPSTPAAATPAPTSSTPSHSDSSANPTPRPTTSSRSQSASNTPHFSAHATRSRPTPTHTRTSPAAAAHKLPLGLPTGDARQVITVAAASHSSTTATLQAWQRDGSGWKRVGPAVRAWLGTAGIGSASEQSTATPAGSFTITQAFGRYDNPGTALPYRQTTPADWWISQPGPLYNTEQHCAADCAFTRGDPNEHLYYATPYYEYALVIDYNRFPVHQGAGSAFFLHVTVHEPTQGCVSVDRDQLVRIMRWLDPRRHPRILMGVG